jgi:eukaryotic-like serine/threonine-protein kinase
MTDDGQAPTIPETAVPTHRTQPSGSPVRLPDDRYVLQTLLGSGGMGEVWLARDERIDRDIAIKISRSSDAETLARFFREARVQGRLEHPSVVPVHDLGDETAPYFAMKRLSGTTLADVIARRDPMWTRRKLLTHFIDVCLAVEFAHQRGVVHRDLKPANLMLGDYGETYVLDWGLARVAGEPGRDTPLPIRTADLRSDSDASGGTKVGAVLGTPGYMAPEQMRGEPIDHRIDVFALGCILFEILAGRPAISREHSFEVTLASPCYRPGALDPSIPPELDDACARATAAKPADRHASARALADDVQRFLDGDRDLERRRTLAAEHARHAAEVFATDTEATRAEAMREAGRAIALDPGNADAQQLLARLLLQLPKTIPPAVHQKVLDEREAAGRTMLRSGRAGYAAFFVLVPLVKLLGIAELWPLMVIDAILAIQFVQLSFAIRQPTPITNLRYGITVAMHVALLGFVGMTTGPVFILPVLLFGSVPIFVVMPTIRIPKTVIFVHALALLVPLALELLDVVPRSFQVTDSALVIRPWAVAISPTVMLAVLIGTTIIQVIANTLILVAYRSDQERRQELVHLQAWQLNQLVAR